MLAAASGSVIAQTTREVRGELRGGRRRVCRDDDADHVAARRRAQVAGERRGLGTDPGDAAVGAGFGDDPQRAHQMSLRSARKSTIADGRLGRGSAHDLRRGPGRWLPAVEDGGGRAGSPEPRRIQPEVRRATS